MTNNLDKNQHYVGPELAPNCLQILIADDRRNELKPRRIRVMNF